jgi:uncharacterized protein
MTRKPKPTPLKWAQLLALTPGPGADPARKPIKLPAMPFKVERTAEQLAEMAMDDAGGFPYGGFLGGVGGQTVAGQLMFGLYFPGYPYLAELAQRSEYRQPVETLAKEMTRAWIKLRSKGKGDKEQKISDITDEFERHNIQLLFRKVTEHDGFYGLGMIYVALRGAQKPETRKLELVIDPRGMEKKSLLGFNTIEPMWITPLVWNSIDPTVPTFYNPQQWMVLGIETHATRMLKFISREVPDIIKPAYNFGGLSLTQMIDPYVQRWLKTVDSVNRLINNFSIITLGTDMGSIIAGGDPGAWEDMLARIKLFTKTRDNQGVFLLDKDRELLEQVAVSLASLPELQAQALEHMAYPTHEPLVVLTGVTPSGLNATSEGEIEVWHNWIHSMQEQLYRPNLTRILRIVQLDMYGTIDDDITFDFEPLKEVTGEEIAAVRKQKIDGIVALAETGIIDVRESREHLATDPDSGFDGLQVDKEIEPLNPEGEENEETEVRISA